MKIRILHCLETIAYGGVEQTILTLVKGLNKEKYSHLIVCTWFGGPIAEAIKKEGVELIAVGAFQKTFEFKKIIKVIKIARNFKPHIIHGAVFEGMTMATFAGFFYRKAVVILEETSDPQNRSKKANLLLRTYSKFADKIQAISPDVGNYLEKTTKVEKGKIIVIENGVSFPEKVESKELLKIKSKFGINDKDFIVGFVGRLYNDHKRVTDLIEAVSFLNIKNIKLLIVGDGVDKTILKRKVKDLELNNQVVFTGYQSETQYFFYLMNVLCVPSSREGFGLVAVEAMLQKKPVIASRVGGLQFIIEDGITGFLIPPYSPFFIAEKLKILLSNQKLIIEMGMKGYEKAIKKYTANRYISDVENMYLESLNHNLFNLL